MTRFAEVAERARAQKARVVVVSGGEPGIAEAAKRIADEGIGRVTTVGPGGLDPARDDRLGDLAALLRESWPERVRDGIHALDVATDPLFFAAGLLLHGEADVCLTAPALPIDLVEDAFRWILGPERATRGRGSVRYVQTADERLLTTVTPDTAGALDARGIAQLALMASRHRSRAVGDEPRVAFLVPPPTMDASHADAEVALAELRALAPGLSAAVEWTWPGSDRETGPRFRARPNVLILPDPVSGHLAHALLRDAGRVRILGPLFPGERWAVAGATEGNETNDLVAVAAVAAAGLAGP